jgi:ABC-type uncharacterized transport system substrate-binding protein
MISTKAIQQTKLRWILLCASLFFSANLYAHPHSWIDMTTHVEGSKSHITGFRMVWVFDPMTTAYLFDGEDMSPEHRQTTLHKLALSVIQNMLSTHYFTYFYDNATPIKYQKVDAATLTEHHGKATLSFHLVLAKPYPFNGHQLKLRIFDPTYYVDMSWETKANITLAPAMKPYCQDRLIAPHPTPAQVSYALSIPASDNSDDTLGQLFTQTLELSCHSNTHAS